MVSPPRRWRPAWIWMAAVLLAGSAFAADDAIPLAPGTSVEGRLAAGEVEVYEASVAGDRRLVVAVEQRGIDVVVEARPSAGETLAADAPLYRQGPELLLLPPGAGSWRIALRSASPAVGPGAYRLTLDELSDADPARLAASSAMSAGGRHAHRGGAEALRLAAARYGEAVARWRQLGDRRLAGQALLAVAVLNRRLNEPRQALEGYREALELLRAAGDEAGEAVALNDLGFVHWQLGEHGRARSLLERAIERQRARGDRYGEAVARGNLCLVAHSEGRLRQAADCYRRALELVAGAGELEFEAAVHGSLGTAYLNLGESELARDSYLRALDLRRAAGDRGGEARALNNLAVLYRSLGEVQQAVLYYGQALEAFEEQGDLRWQARTLNNLGYAYYSLGELERARALLRQALPLRRRVVDRRGEAATSRNLGLVESGLGHHEVAAAHLRRALELSRARGDRRGTAAALIALGRERRRLGATVAAIDDFVQALIAAEESGDRGQRAEALHQIGDARLELGEASAAVLSLRAALEERRRIRDPAGQAETLTALAAAEERLGRPADALARIEEALEVIESLRAGIADPHLRATFSGVRRRAYELHLALLMKRHAAEPRGGFDRAALESSERARARTLLELLEEAGAGLRRGASPELAERRRRLLERLGLKAQRQLELLSAGASPDEARIAELELFAVLAELERVEAEIRRLNPSYAALTRPPPIAVAEIQQLLDGDDLLLEYALGEEKSFLWAVGRDSLQSFELPGRAAIEAAARRVYGQLST
ncbi:MAG: tetratricopeptide repeat protein, partial [Acidobacteria bacterium]